MAMTDLRRATRHDIPACADVVTGWIADTDWMPDGPSRAEVETMLNDAFDDREIWVSGAPAVAYMSVDPATARIGALYCAVTGRGLGRALLDQAKLNRDFLWLHTHGPNLRAQCFYRREGFAEVSRHPAAPPDTVPEIRMEWHRAGDGRP